MLDWLLSEWSKERRVIRDAPLALVLTLLVAIGVAWIGIDQLYSHEISTQKATIEFLQQQLETDRARSHDQQNTTAPQARTLNDDQRRNLIQVFSKKKAEFPTLLIGATSGDPQSYARDFAEVFNIIGIRVGGIAIAYPLKGDTQGLFVGVKDVDHMPAVAKDFIEGMGQAGSV